RQAVTVRPFKTKALLTEALLAADTGRAMVGQPLLPIGESARGYGEHGRCHFARAGAATCDVWKREIRHDRAGEAELVRIVEVIHLRRVEIDGLLHPAQAQRSREERVVSCCIARQRSDVVKTLDLVEHGLLLPAAGGTACRLRLSIWAVRALRERS